MNLVPLLWLQLRVARVEPSTFRTFPAAEVTFRDGGGALFVSVPFKIVGRVLSLAAPRNRPIVFIAGTKATDMSLLRMRIEEGLDAAEYYLRNWRSE